jgi:hypothetical protein
LTRSIVHYQLTSSDFEDRLVETMASHPDTKIDCSKVYVKRSSFATTETEFDGAFAAVPIKKGK